MIEEHSARFAELRDLVTSTARADEFGGFHHDSLQAADTWNLEYPYRNDP